MQKYHLPILRGSSCTASFFYDSYLHLCQLHPFDLCCAVNPKGQEEEEEEEEGSLGCLPCIRNRIKDVLQDRGRSKLCTAMFFTAV